MHFLGVLPPYIRQYFPYASGGTIPVNELDELDEPQLRLSVLVLSQSVTRRPPLASGHSLPLSRTPSTAPPTPLMLPRKQTCTSSIRKSQTWLPNSAPCPPLSVKTLLRSNHPALPRSRPPWPHLPSQPPPAAPTSYANVVKQTDIHCQPDGRCSTQGGCSPQDCCRGGPHALTQYSGPVFPGRAAARNGPDASATPVPNPHRGPAESGQRTHPHWVGSLDGGPAWPHPGDLRECGQQGEGTPGPQAPRREKRAVPRRPPLPGPASHQERSAGQRRGDQGQE
eukprot:jgi/Mesvir1/3523/Mv25304-RA.1